MGIVHRGLTQRAKQWSSMATCHAVVVLLSVVAEIGAKWGASSGAKYTAGIKKRFDMIFGLECQEFEDMGKREGTKDL